MQVTTKTLESLQEFNRWRRNAPAGDFSLFDFVCCVSTPDLLFGFAELFNPELVLHDGAYFIASRFGEEAYKAWKAQGTGLREI